MIDTTGTGTPRRFEYGSLSAIYEGLQSEDFEKRLRAVLYVGEHGWKGSLDYLLRMLEREDNSFVLASLVKVVAAQGKASVIDILRPLLSYPDHRVRANTVEALGMIDSERLFDIIAPCLCDPDHRVCANTVRAIWRFNREKALGKLAELLTAGSVPERRSVMYVLGEIDDPGIGPLIERALGDEDDDVRERAGAMQAKQASRFPVSRDPEVASDDRYGQVVSGFYLLGQEGKLDALKDIERRGEAGYLKPLLGYLPHETDEVVLAMILLVLGKLGGSEVVPALREYLAHANHRVRANAVEALSYTGDRNIFSYLSGCFNDENNRVQANAAKALWAAAPQACLDKLREMSSSPRSLHRLSAIYVLSVIGTPLCKIILKDLTRDRDAGVAGRARAALRKIRGGVTLPRSGPGLARQLISLAGTRWVAGTAALAGALAIAIAFHHPAQRPAAPGHWKPAGHVKAASPGAMDEQLRQDNLSREQAARIKPLLKQALAHESAGRWEEAKEQYQNILKIAGTCSQAHNNLGFIYFQEGQYVRSREHYEKALAVNPKYVSALNNYGFLMLKLGRLSDSKAAYRKALEYAPDDKIVLNNMAYTWYLEGDYEKARRIYERILVRDPYYSVARNNLGSLLIAMNDFPRAAVELQDVLDDQSNVDGLMRRRAKMALELLEKSVPASSGNEERQ